MPYWGKIIGTVAGLATGKPWLAALGLILGHQFDIGFADIYDVDDAHLLIVTTAS